MKETNTTITKAAIIDSIHDKVGGTKREISEITEMAIEVMKEELANGGSIKVSGLGKFDVKKKDARLGRNPKTRQEMMIDERLVVRFGLSKVFKSYLNRSQEDETEENS